jgi:hypothetical protein
MRMGSRFMRCATPTKREPLHEQTLTEISRGQTPSRCSQRTLRPNWRTTFLFDRAQRCGRILDWGLRIGCGSDRYCASQLKGARVLQLQAASLEANPMGLQSVMVEPLSTAPPVNFLDDGYFFACVCAGQAEFVP